MKFTELDILPKIKIPYVYDKIKYFTENFHSHIVAAFYYIILHLTRCPKCNNVLKVVTAIKMTFLGLSLYLGISMIKYLT